MKRIVFINETCGNGSHGRICLSLAKEFEAEGYEAKIAFGRTGVVPEEARKYAVRIGNGFSVRLHALYTRLFDKHGFGSYFATKRFLKWLDSYNPDIVWLHNLHGYYINISLLFSWLKLDKNRRLTIRWTLHDCWAFTGHCSHFSYIKCGKWKNHCNNCPQKKRYPKAYIDNSFNNFKTKKALFCGLDNMEIYTPSHWLANLVRQSFLKAYPITVYKNPIDKSVFTFRNSNLREKYGIGERIMLLSVATVWNDRKGLHDLVELSKLIDERFVLIIVGLTKKQMHLFSPNVIFIKHISNQFLLSELYSVSNFLINPSYEETFGMTVAEAQLCGCKPIIYKDTASEEIITKGFGVAVEPGSENIFKAVIKEIAKQ